MKASIMEAPRRMRVGIWETPKAGPSEVLIKVQAAGICAGDIYFYLGKNPYAEYPQICGHEVTGTIAEVGSGKIGVQPGMPVVVEPFLGCGTCYPCRIGKSNCCAHLKIIGVHQPGGYAEYLTAPATHVHPVPAGMTPLYASFAEPVAIGVQACRRAAVSRGEYVLILGCGPIGLALIEVVLSYGARPVATDTVQSRLTFAEKLGAAVIPAGPGLLKTVQDQTNGEGAPVVIEATGNPAAMEQTVHLVAAGGRVVIVGLVKAGVGVNFPGLDFTRKEMTILGSRASVNCFPEALELLAKGAIRYPAVATAFNLWDAPKVFDQLTSKPNEIHKGVFIVQE